MEHFGYVLCKKIQGDVFYLHEEYHPKVRLYWENDLYGSLWTKTETCAQLYTKSLYDDTVYCVRVLFSFPRFPLPDSRSYYADNTTRCLHFERRKNSLEKNGSEIFLDANHKTQDFFHVDTFVLAKPNLRWVASWKQFTGIGSSKRKAVKDCIHSMPFHAFFDVNGMYHIAFQRCSVSAKTKGDAINKWFHVQAEKKRFFNQ
jgi:hypothetical protein